MKNIILIVDPFSTGKMYAEKFHQLGYQCYAVLSSPTIPELFRKNTDFRYFINQQFLSVEQVKLQFKKQHINSVVIGSETGVYAGEALADYFQVKGNDPKTSHFRRDKFAMQQCLKQAGLDYIKSNLISASDTLPELNVSSRYVLKPLNSAGTEGVRFCTDKNQLLTEIDQLQWGKTNITGEINHTFLLQEFIDGEEYVVDMIANNDQIYTASLCRYKKSFHNGCPFVYEYMEILDPSELNYQPLIDYAHQCAVALNFSVGPIHMEIMRDDRRIVMIEAGGRLHGGVAPKIFQQCYQPDLLSQAVSLYHKNAALSTAKLTQYAKVVFMINHFSNK